MFAMTWLIPVITNAESFVCVILISIFIKK